MYFSTVFPKTADFFKKYFVAYFEQTGYLSPFSTSKGALIIWI